MFWFNLFKALFGEETAHKLTGWEFYPMPAAEKVNCYKDRTFVQQSANTVIDWPSWINDDNQKFSFTVQNKPWMGSFYGAVLQNGNDKKRSLTYGYLVYGQRNKTSIPLPASGKYLIEGMPNPGNTGSDRHCNITDPTDGTVHEMIQFDPNLAEGPLANQALNWGKWKDGKLIAGRAVTAAQIAVHPLMWTLESATNPHRLGFAMADYVGGDGALEEGPKCGQLYYLPGSSASYSKMVALGGECKSIAVAMNVYGIILYDRSGYYDSDNSTDPKIPLAQRRGTKPKTPGLAIQLGSQWAKTNLNQLDIRLTDLQEAV